MMIKIKANIIEPGLILAMLQLEFCWSLLLSIFLYRHIILIISKFVKIKDQSNFHD